jgi:hypothetical protein
MTTYRQLAGAGLIAAGLVLTPLAAHAQSAAPLAAPATATYSFDGYRVLAVTAGVIVGATVAAVVTDGLIVPAYLYVVGGEAAGGMTMFGGMAAGAGGGAGEVVASSGIGHAAYGAVGHAGYQTLRGAMSLLGAIGGGFYADSWYMGG